MGSISRSSGLSSCIGGVVAAVSLAAVLAFGDETKSGGDGTLPADIGEIVAAYRKAIVILEADATLDAPTRVRATFIGRLLFHENRRRLDGLTQRLLQRLPPASPSSDQANSVESFLTILERASALRDADKLVFTEVLDELLAQLRESGGKRRSTTNLRQRIEQDLKDLSAIQARYDKELGRIAARLDTRALKPQREAWNSYLKFIRAQYTPAGILNEYAEPTDGETGTRGGAVKPDPEREFSGLEVPKKTVVLTFDDGPHPRHTDRILDILKKYGIASAVFFQVGQNIGTVKADGSVALTKASAASKRILESGSVLANHTNSHALLTRLDEEGQKLEIDTTSKLLQQIDPDISPLFRAPYGARNRKTLAALESDQLKSVMWNIDSKDWADPVPKSIANRVLETIEREGRGIILFHDIHARTIEALPLVIEALQADGYQFASWNGSGFSVARAGSSAPVLRATALADTPYRESWAVVIGIDDYAHWPKLRYAVNDADGVKKTLVDQYRFKPENIVTLINGEATREAILSALGDKLSNPELVKRDDRVFVFFAGHGATRKLASGRDLGYIVPVDADPKSFQGQSISMTNFQDIAEGIPAKHVLFIMDSCYSGLALTRGAAPRSYLKEMTRRPARQIFTAGGADQEVADGGPNGHSVFTWTLLQALEGRGDLNGDGVIVASELAAYVSPLVSSLSKQTPAFGSMAGSGGGEFVFELRHENEFLSEQSSELSEQAIQLNKEIEALRAAIDEKDRLNRKLQQELAVARSGATPSAPTAQSRNDQGMLYFREKRYREALAEFEAASQLDPNYALSANNAGFALYKLADLEGAVAWFQRAINTDPNRAVAYLNLGDAYVGLKRGAEAKAAYQRYLELQPAGKTAAEVKEKLSRLALGEAK